MQFVNTQLMTAQVVFGLFPLLALLALFSIRRKFRLWRKIGGSTWYSRLYIGETTLFPTYRRRGCRVWVLSTELSDCYMEDSASVKETGRHRRRLDEEKKLDERAAAAAAAKSAESAEPGKATSLRAVA